MFKFNINTLNYRDIGNNNNLSVIPGEITKLQNLRELLVQNFIK